MMSSCVQRPQVVPAQHCDINQMIAICAEHLVENNREKLSAADFSKQGFLIRKLTQQDAEEMINDKENHFFQVIKNGDEVLGYLSACDIKKTSIEFQQKVFQASEIRDFVAKNGEKIFYHKQIVKKLGAKNVGQNLLLAMFKDAKNRGYEHVVCRIVHQPFYNEASIIFHEKFGFRKIGSMEENGVGLGIYLKELCD